MNVCSANCQTNGDAGSISLQRSFRPPFAAIRRVFTGLFAAQRSFGHRPIDTLPSPVHAKQFVIDFYRKIPQLIEDSKLGALLTVRVSGASGRKFWWNCVSLASCSQTAEDRVGDST